MRVKENCIEDPIPALAGITMGSNKIVILAGGTQNVLPYVCVNKSN